MAPGTEPAAQQSNTGMDDYLRRQDGVITRAQALGCGLSAGGISRRVRSGHWRRCGPGVYFVDDRPFHTAARIRAAVWSHGPQAVASGLAAVWWHGLIPQLTGPVEVTVPRGAHGRARPGVRLRRRDLTRADIVERRGLRVTEPALSVLEAAVGEGGPGLLDVALQRRIELAALWRAHRRGAGRYGAAAAERLLRAAADGARSAAERLLVELLRGAGITGWVTDHPVAGYRVDVGFPDLKLAVETDGYAFHSAHRDFRGDRKRQNAIILAGWLVLRFTWFDLVEQPERVIAEVRRAISARK